jgi:hypothetical protein
LCTPNHLAWFHIRFHDESCKAIEAAVMEKL